VNTDNESAGEHAAGAGAGAAAAMYVKGGRGRRLTWGMKASTPPSSMDTTTAIALIFWKKGRAGMQKTVAWPVQVCVRRGKRS